MVRPSEVTAPLTLIVVRGLLSVVAFALIATITIGGLIGSSRIRDRFLEPWVDVPPPQARISALDEGMVRLDVVSLRTPFVGREGVWAMDNTGNFGLVGEILDRSYEQVVRRVELLDGSSLRVGSVVSVHPWAFGPDPTVGLNLVHDELSLESALGPLGGWLIEGDPHRWAIVLRDGSDERRAALRLVDILARLNLTVVVLDYRNQGASPPDPSGLYRFGAAEWRDVEVGVEYAASQGAEHIVLFGQGMGGSAAVSFLVRSEMADQVDGVALEGPHLNARASIEADIARRDHLALRLPISGFMTRAAMAFTGWRTRLDWDDVNYVAFGDSIRVPMLIMHGGADREAPLEVSREMAIEARDFVRLEVFESAGHGEAWNVDRDRYQSLIQSFVANTAQ